MVLYQVSQYTLHYVRAMGFRSVLPGLQVNDFLFLVWFLRFIGDLDLVNEEATHRYRDDLLLQHETVSLDQLSAGRLYLFQKVTPLLSKLFIDCALQFYLFFRKPNVFACLLLDRLSLELGFDCFEVWCALLCISESHLVSKV